MNTLTREAGLFSALRRAVPKPEARDALENECISDTMCRLVDERVSARRDPVRDQSLIWRLGRGIAEILKRDQRWRVEDAGEEVERLLGL